MTKEKKISNYGEALLSYGEYLKVPELLRLQRCLSQPGHHDELQFIIVHQAYELWFKLILHELDAACASMRQRSLRSIRSAIHNFERVITIQRVLLQQIHVIETMRPVDFLRFRDPLKPASGFQSTQFREIEFLSGLKHPKLLELCKGDPELVARTKKRYDEPTIWDAFTVAMDGADLLGLYEDPEQNPDLYRLAECLIEFDEHFQLWREHHFRMVERMIGDKPGTGAAVNQGMEGVRYLRTMLQQHCFPELWALRGRIGL